MINKLEFNYSKNFTSFKQNDKKENNKYRTNVNSIKNKQARNMSFSGKHYPTRWYSKWFIEEVKPQIDLPLDKYKTWIQDKLKDFDKELDRYLDLYDFWGSKQRKYLAAREQNYFDLRKDLTQERLNRQLAETERENLISARKLKFEHNKQEIKEKELNPKFVYQIQREREGKPASIPNCIMIVGQDKDVTKELIEWTGKNTNCKFVQLKHTDNILEHLENAEDYYQQTRERTLFHINNFDQLINPELTPQHQIASLKDIMSSASEDYHSTIIFDAKDPSKLNHESIQNHRIEQIDVNIKKPEPIPELPEEPPIEKDQVYYSSDNDHYPKRKEPRDFSSSNGGSQTISGGMACG